MPSARRSEVILSPLHFHTSFATFSLRFNLLIFPEQSLSPPLSLPLLILPPSPHLLTLFAIFLSVPSCTFSFALSLSSYLSKVLLSSPLSPFLTIHPLELSLSSSRSISQTQTLSFPALPHQPSLSSPFSRPCSPSLSLSEDREQPV